MLTRFRSGGIMPPLLLHSSVQIAIGSDSTALGAAKMEIPYRFYSNDDPVQGFEE